MKRYRITVPVTRASGTQTYECQAESMEDARAQFDAGVLECTDEELEVEEVDEEDIEIEEIE